MRVLVTGASGFVGSAIVSRLCADNRHEVAAAVRRLPADTPACASYCEVADMDANTSWSAALANVDVVIHTAARVHVMRDRSLDPLSEYRRVNVDGSLNLARQAIAAGVQRFVFISSIKVNGENTLPGKPFTASDQPDPTDPYGISKLEAEQGLQALSRGSTMDYVIIRPPLVYGPGVKANFRSMMRWLWRGVPLPFARVDNKRSFVARDNLVDLICTCIDAPAAANQLFLVSDGKDLSTSELLRSMGQALGRPARLLPVPVWLMTAAARLLGRKAVAQRLFGSLQVDIGKTCDLLDWEPPSSVADALRLSAKHFIEFEAGK